MTKEECAGLFTLAGIRVLGMWEIANRYWPDDPHYEDIRRQQPWWLVKTPAGLIQIGWRKRVISIDWSDTAIRTVITDDEVTKDNTMVHAWSTVRALEYLTKLAKHMPRDAIDQLLVEAGNYVRSAMSDEDPETQRLSAELWARIREAVPGLPA